MSRPGSARCTSCGRPILFRFIVRMDGTTGPNPAPIDLDPDQARGTIALRDERTAKVVTGDGLRRASDLGDPPLHTSHFYTCPNANQHRRARR